MCRELPQLGEENIQEEIVIAMVTGDCIETGDPLTEEVTQVEDLLIEEDTLIEMQDTLTEENTLVKDPLIEVEAPWKRRTPWLRTPGGGGGLLMEEDPLDLLEDKDHQALKDPLDQ